MRVLEPTMKLSTAVLDGPGSRLDLLGAPQREGSGRSRPPRTQQAVPGSDGGTGNPPEPSPPGRSHQAENVTPPHFQAR